MKFWYLDQKQWQCNQTLQMEDTVYSLDLNKSNNKLIVNIFNQKQIKVFDKNENQWHELYTIQLTKNTLRMCFIIDNYIAVQLLKSDLLQIFNLNQIDNQYKLGQEIKVKYGELDCPQFPMQFIKSRNLLISKNRQYINILRKQQNEEFTLIQTIEFGHKSLYGWVSDDGSYLFTLDAHSKQIQVRRLQII